MINSTPNSELPSFTDAAGRTWRLLISIGRARLIRDVTGIDFAQIEDGGLFLRLARDPETFAQVLWLLCEKQADAARPPITPDDFAEGLGGVALDAAREAILAAAISFTPAPVRGAVESVIRKTIEAHEVAMAEVKDLIDAAGGRLIEEAAASARQAARINGLESPA